ncbi:MAG: PadR family transcriptional regulator [Bacteroidetes bacterium]|nr:PadR family transcriptional regulator [Bacteroidota bacterium]
MNDLPQQILKGSLSAIILKLLSENEAMYGYEICQRVKEITAGQMRVTEGALYPALHKLEGEGILRTHTQQVEGRTRKYYSIVPDQHGQAVSRLAQMQAFLDQLQQVLNPQPNVRLT